MISESPNWPRTMPVAREPWTSADTTEEESVTSNTLL